MVYKAHHSSKTYSRLNLMVIDKVLRRLINVLTHMINIFWDFFPFLSSFGTFSTQCGV